MEKIHCSAVIFDLDGTLYNKKGLSLQMAVKLWRTVPFLKKSNAVRRELKGVDCANSDKYYERFYKGIAGSKLNSESSVKNWYRDKFYTAFIDILHRKYKARSSINEFLERLQKKIPLALLSDYALVGERLDALSISREHFKVIASSEDYGVLKPSARPLEDIARKLDVEKDRVLVVGDRADTDGAAAELAGMMFYHIDRSSRWTDFCSEILKIE